MINHSEIFLPINCDIGPPQMKKKMCQLQQTAEWSVRKNVIKVQRTKPQFHHQNQPLLIFSIYPILNVFF